MSSIKLSDYQSPLVIDVGSDSVKFAQPHLDTYAISSNIHKSKKIGNNLINNSTPMDNYGTPHNTPNTEELINSNTIFDYNLFTDSFPTMLGMLNSPSDDNDNFEKLKRLSKSGDLNKIIELPEMSKYDNIISCLFDPYVNEKDLKFDYEPIWGGRINNFDVWSNIIERVGEIKYKKYNFIKSLYSDTPVIITQHALGFEDLKNQVKKIYEIMFEQYKCPYLLLCSQAMLNLFSHNLLSGLVVDMGESGTHISTVINGYTNYDKTISSSFLSGRNVTALMALYSTNMSQRKIYTDEVNNVFQIDLKTYLKMKSIKESKKFGCIFPDANIQNDIETIEIFDQNIKQTHISSFNYLYTFPEIYRTVLSTVNYTDLVNPAHKGTQLSSIDLLKNLQSTISFILYGNKDYKKFSYRDTFDHFDVKKFEERMVLPYLHQTVDTVQKTLIIRDNSFANKEELVKFRQFSLTHLIISQLEKHAGGDSLNSDKYLNIVFAGGQLNTPNLTTLIEKDFDSLLLRTSNEGLKLHFSDKVDHSINFYKGANYLSKIEDLDNIMISRQEFYECGSEYLTFNYI